MDLKDHASVVLSGDESAIMDISEELSFESPGAKYDPRVRQGRWDGKIRLVDRRRGTLYAGLWPRVAEVCKKKNIDLEWQPPKEDRWTDEDVQAFIDTLDLPEKYRPRDYQLAAVRRALCTKRQLFLSPTSSGKSLIIYCLTRAVPGRTLIVVPTVGLVHQMVSDFRDYGSQQAIHKIQDGRDVPAGTDVVVSTWQSIYEQDPEWFEQFGLVIGDEAHLFKAKSLVGIMMKMPLCEYRFGFTGTLDGSKVHQFILEGLFGPVMQVTTTSDLMDAGHVAKLKVEIVVLNHDQASKKDLEMKTLSALLANQQKASKKEKRGAIIYRQEIGHIYAHERRNRFICRLATKLEGNVLVLFHHVEHGNKLYDQIVSDTFRPVHLINGGVDGLERDEIRNLVDSQDDAILLASVGTTSTGVSIRRINNVVMASPWKSRIVNLQSIGRGLRLAADKASVTVYDLADILSSPVPNVTLRHLDARRKIYLGEKFDFRVNKVDL